MQKQVLRRSYCGLSKIAPDNAETAGKRTVLEKGKKRDWCHDAL